MKKVVYNSCFGGFGLSPQALVYLLLLGFPLAKRPKESSGYTEADFPLLGPRGIRAHSYQAVLLHDGFIYDYPDSGDDTLRSHPVLVKVVEMLGKSAGGSYSKLSIETIDDNALYRIDEYDGNESVAQLSTDLYTQGYLMTEVMLPPELQIGTDGKLITPMMLTAPDAI